ncbi:hypothetical protein EVAR_66851_1 [Eumeta japonica]|uniref:Uncharacterized protein n=1 Tax=Eumeta variegata TaxID=151549 RepID=A0A4C1ZBK5_EUMVA|nr:hypothetical protein EVAR_66851_1 [Eumeta japonica]
MHTGFRPRLPPSTSMFLIPFPVWVQFTIKSFKRNAYCNTEHTRPAAESFYLETHDPESEFQLWTNVDLYIPLSIAVANKQSAQNKKGVEADVSNVARDSKPLEDFYHG